MVTSDEISKLALEYSCTLSYNVTAKYANSERELLESALVSFVDFVINKEKSKAARYQEYLKLKLEFELES